MDKILKQLSRECGEWYSSYLLSSKILGLKI